MSSSSKNPINEEDLKNFCAVTGATIERARFFVEAANGNLEIAIESFFETDGGNDNEMPTSEVTSGSNSRSFGQMNTEDNSDSSDDEDFVPHNFKPVQKTELPKKTTQATRKAGIFTFSEMNQDDEDESEEKGQAFYAGGSETSGQQILGPTKKKNPENIIKDLFQKAKEHGAQEVDQSEQATSKKGPTVYGGGYRLGTGNEPTEVIPGPSKPKQQKVSVLKLWKNGFNIDDGQLRSYEDEKNKEFLQSIQRGELPRELVNQANGGEVHLDMQDHRDEEFVAPKAAYTLYNEGYKLGSSAPPVVSNASANDKVNNEECAKKNLALNAANPNTQIQIRLSDGSRLVIKVNLTHRISDLRSYINTARPEYSNRTYALLTSFPNKELTNNNETVEEAKLQNAVIIQKL